MPVFYRNDTHEKRFPRRNCVAPRNDKVQYSTPVTTRSSAFFCYSKNRSLNATYGSLPLSVTTREDVVRPLESILWRVILSAAKNLVGEYMRGWHYPKV